MPKMSMTMTEGEVVEITVSVGQVVSQGDVVAVVGTDKTDMEVESDYSGTVTEIIGAPGAVISVGEPLLILETEGEDLLAGMFAPTPEESVIENTIPSPVVESQVITAPIAQQNREILAMPGARKIAREQGINLAEVVPKSPSGVIKQSDLLVSDQRVEKARLHIASVVETAMQIPQFSISGQLKLKRNLPKSFEQRFVSLARAWVATLNEHPKLKQRFAEGGFLEIEPRVAALVRTDLGFVSPVIGVSGIETEAWAARTAEILSSARGNKIAVENLSGATTAITDLSEFGITQANTLLFPPQTSGFNIGAVRQKKDKFRVEFTLVIDHRISDPGDAALVIKTFEKKLNEVLGGNF
jgi:pyruvate/2-oxoglutarate dehydrogenase complex dihydrolipoamide acyltransferase (E2) component